MISPVPDCCSSVAMERSMSASARTSVGIAEIPSVEPAASANCKKDDAFGAVSGLTKIAAPVTVGMISLSNSTHLPPSDGSNGVNPVTFPPGRS